MIHERQPPETSDASREQRALNTIEQERIEPGCDRHPKSDSLFVVVGGVEPGQQDFLSAQSDARGSLLSGRDSRRIDVDVKPTNVRQMIERAVSVHQSGADSMQHWDRGSPHADHQGRN